MAMQKTIPEKLKKEMDTDPFYSTCCLYGQRDHVCEGRITREHAVIVAGNRVNKKWAIIPLCAKYHEVDQYQDSHNMDKQMNIWVALNRATEQDIKEIYGEGMYSQVTPLMKCAELIRLKERLNKLYGVYRHEVPKDWSIYQDKPKEAPKAIPSPFRSMFYPISDEDQKKIDFIIKMYLDTHNIQRDQFDIIKHGIDTIYEAVKRFSQLPEVVAHLKMKKKL